ncbi:hypothetical protein [Spirosoma spitsbergense]|uniref:hypothetical protein n=1 Tax=Spirosoma spitsbergense TaxID=431554 RepID=UPI00146E7F2C|nr:hypothetical protein [Spirosoma spitsbergense]
MLADKGLFAPYETDASKYCLMAGGGFSLSVMNNAIHPYFILSLINSKLIFSVLRAESNKFRGGWITCTKQYFANLPIKVISLEAQKPFISFASEIITTKAANLTADTSALEAEIDKLVYALYELTDEEIAIVEGR